MRILILSLALCFLSCKVQTKDLESKENYTFFHIIKKGGSSSIQLKKNKTMANKGHYGFYKEIINYSDKDKLSMIQELLKHKGDKRTASFYISNNNKNLSDFYTGCVSDYSIEVEALYLINQIYFTNPFYYAPYPILINSETKKEINYDTESINEVYKYYESWFKKLQRKGFRVSKKKKIIPLAHRNKYRWIYGVWIDPNSKLEFDLTETNNRIKNVINNTNR